MFNQLVNYCSQQQFNYMEGQYPQLENPLNYNLNNQMNPQFWTCPNGSHANDQFYDIFEPEAGRTRLQESGLKESEVVDELLQILVECLKKADVRTQEVLLVKFFFEIEKDISLERFIVERIKHSKLNFLLESLKKVPGRSGDDCDRFFGADGVMAVSTREVDVSTSQKLERFKVKNIQVGQIVKEEAR